MASVEQLPSGKWRGVYRDSGGNKKHTRPRRLKSDAKDDATEAEVKARRQAPTVRGTSARITWGGWYDQIAPRREFDSDTPIVERSAIKLHVRPHWGDVPLNQITQRDVQKWVDGLATRFEPSYVRRIYSIFRVIVNAAIPDVLTASPLVGIDLPKVRRKQKPFVTVDDAEALAEVLPQEYVDAVEFGLETGLRPGELAGLHNDQIDPDGWLTVRTVHVLRRGMMRDHPKDDDVRVVPLTEKALDIWRRRTAGRDMRSGCGVPHFGGEPCRNALVFTNTLGDPLRSNRLRLMMLKAAREVDIAPKTAYALRRGYGTRLGRAGIDAFELAELMGHASVEQTKEYVQQSPGALNRVRAALGEAPPLRVVEGERGTERGTDADSQTLPEAEQEGA